MDERFELHLDIDEFHHSTIYHAILRGNHADLLVALHGGEENVLLRDPDFTYTYLHVVVLHSTSAQCHKYIPMIYQLSNAGVDMHATDYQGRTALELAIVGELPELITPLVRCGAEPLMCYYRSIIRGMESPFELELLDTLEKLEPGLWSAVTQNNASQVQLLLNSWCRVNVVRGGKTLIEYAKHTHKSLDIVQTLQEYEVTLEFVHATLAGDEKRMLEHLMEPKLCDPYVMDISYQERWSSPLSARSLRDTALAMEHTHILHLLPEGTEDEDEDPAPADGGGVGRCVVPRLSLPSSSSGSAEPSDDYTPPESARRRWSLLRRSTSIINGKGNLTERSIKSLQQTIKRVSTERLRSDRLRPQSVPVKPETATQPSVYMEQWYYFGNEKDDQEQHQPTNKPVMKSTDFRTSDSDSPRKHWSRQSISRASAKLKTTSSTMCVIS